jgi:hypothetical protein
MPRKPTTVIVHQEKRKEEKGKRRQENAMSDMVHFLPDPSQFIGHSTF